MYEREHMNSLLNSVEQVERLLRIGVYRPGGPTSQVSSVGEGGPTETRGGGHNFGIKNVLKHYCPTRRVLQLLVRADLWRYSRLLHRIVEWSDDIFTAYRSEEFGFMFKLFVFIFLLFPLKNFNKTLRILSGWPNQVFYPYSIALMHVHGAISFMQENFSH